MGIEVAAALAVVKLIAELAATASRENRPITPDEWRTVNDRIAAADARLDGPDVTSNP